MSSASSIPSPASPARGFIIEMVMNMSKQLQIHNSTAEFLIFQAEDKAEGIQVFYQDENIWATQEVIATLFDKGRSTITEHLKNIFASGELARRGGMSEIPTNHSTWSNRRKNSNT